MSNYPYGLSESSPNTPWNPSEATLRNSIRQDAIQAIGTLEDRLHELGNGYKNILAELAELKEYLERDLEV